MIQFDPADDSSWRVAVLHQGSPTPAVNGVSKPPKPGGYKDSSSDIACALESLGLKVVLPEKEEIPCPARDDGWSFPDTETSVRQAIELMGANVVFANTSLHSAHALLSIAEAHPHIFFVGQHPPDVEKFEDKAWCNQWLASDPELANEFPTAKLARIGDSATLHALGVPVIAKPVRGRGSHGVTAIKETEALDRIARQMWQENDAILLEQYLTGEEITLTVMPPGSYERPVGKRDSYWSLPVVVRFNHVDGIAPYNGVTAVTENSRVIDAATFAADPTYSQAQKAAEFVAKKCRSFAPIRIDARRPGAGKAFKLFDVNMKPNATGPGRPGREQQLSLTGMAAYDMGWSYPVLLRNIIRNARPLSSVL